MEYEEEEDTIGYSHLYDIYEPVVQSKHDRLSKQLSDVESYLLENRHKWLTWTEINEALSIRRASSRISELRRYYVVNERYRGREKEYQIGNPIQHKAKHIGFDITWMEGSPITVSVHKERDSRIPQYVIDSLEKDIKLLIQTKLNRIVV